MQIEILVKAMKQGFAPMEKFPGFGKPWRVKTAEGDLTTVTYEPRDLD